MIIPNIPVARQTLLNKDPSGKPGNLANDTWYRYWNDLGRGVHDLQAGPVAPAYTVATLPVATGREGAIIYVSNESGGATIAFSDGTNWRRAQDRAIVT